MEGLFQPSSRTDSGIRTSDLPSITLYRENFGTRGRAVHWELPPLETVARLLPDFADLQLLGRGGMGAVYRARSLKLDRLVAVKLLPPECCEEEHYRRRFHREAQAMAHLRHPRITSLFEVGTAVNQMPYIVMEHVEGTNLQNAIKSGTLTLEGAKRILCDVCEGLAYAHESGVIHRDIKPSNVLIDRDGRAKLADFGTARWQPLGDVASGTTGALFGTRDYLAPELLGSGTTIDHRVDIYSLGVMTYEAFCRELPRGNFPVPSCKVEVDRRLDLIVARAMQMSPAQRYPTVADLHRDLSRLRVTKKVAPARDSPQATRRWRARAIWIIAAVAILTAGLVVLEARHAPPARELAKPAEVMASARVTPPLAAPVPTVADVQPVWHDWFSEQATLPASFIKVEEGYTLGKGFASGVTIQMSPVLRDQVVRVTYHAADLKPRPLVRVQLRAAEHMEAFYGAFNQTSEWQITCRLPGQKVAALANAPKSPADPPEVQVAELRVVGDRLSFRLNGEEKTSKKGRGITEGRAAFYCTGGITIHALEWADLSPPR